MESDELYPPPTQQDSLRLLIARNLAFLEAYENENPLVHPHISNATLVLTRLGGLARLSYEEVALLQRILKQLNSLGIPVIDHHAVFDSM